MFDAIRVQLQPPVCDGGVTAERWRNRLTQHPENVQRQLRDALPRMAYVTEALIEADLPTEFAFIPLIESGYRPDARGRGGPLGLWQFVPSTARAHGLRVGGQHDERLSIERSTAAAVDHLLTLQREFGDWRATAMAYNAGAGAVQRAFARAGRRDIDVPRRQPAGLRGITYAYVAKLDAWACLISDPARFGLRLPDDPFVPLSSDEDHAAGVASRAAADTTSAAAIPPVETASPRRYRVQTGDTLWSLARRFGTSVRALQDANGLGQRTALRVGQWLQVP